MASGFYDAHHCDILIRENLCSCNILYTFDRIDIELPLRRIDIDTRWNKLDDDLIS